MFQYVKIMVAGIVAMIGGSMLMMLGTTPIAVPGVMWKGGIAVGLGLALTLVATTIGIRESKRADD